MMSGRLTRWASKPRMLINNGTPTNDNYTYDRKSNRVKHALGSSTHFAYADDGTLMGEHTPDAISIDKEYFLNMYDRINN